jgi:hypothetical protein
MVRSSTQGCEDAFDLFQALARSEYYFGETLTELAVVVYPGKTQILKRQGPKTLQSRGHR